MPNSERERPEPPAENLARVGSQPFPMHVKRGHAILDILEEEITKQGMSITADRRVYDFGCGVGRVIIPFSERHDVQIYGSDVDPTAIEFLKENFPDDFQVVTTGYEPPLPFEDNFFDVVFSISVWSHFPADLQTVWLREMKRIMKDNALLFVSTAGFSHLENWHAKGKRTDITTDHLREEGFLFIRNERLDKRPELFPGVTGDWGVFYQTPEHVHDTWSEFFRIEAIHEARVGKQDLVVMRNA